VPLSRAELLRYETGTPAANLSNGAATFIPSTNDPDASRASRFFSGALLFTGRPTDNFGYTVSYQGNRTDSAFYDGPNGTGFEPFGNTRTDFDGRIHTLNARTDFRLGRANLITAGYEFERERFINRSFPATVADNAALDVAERSHAFFIQDQVRLFDDRLQLSAAFRTQSFALDAPRFMPTATAPFGDISFVSPPRAYTGDGSLLTSSASRGRNCAPTSVTATARLRSLNASVYDPRPSAAAAACSPPSATRASGPERSIAFDAGLDQTFSRRRARASATYFYTRLQEVIAFDFSGLVVQPDPFGRFGGYVNTRGGLRAASS
jgi:iron complex outermembrane receptor protein